MMNVKDPGIPTCFIFLHNNLVWDFALPVWDVMPWQDCGRRGSGKNWTILKMWSVQNWINIPSVHCCGSSFLFIPPLSGAGRVRGIPECVCSATLWVRFKSSFFPSCELILLWLYFFREYSEEWLFKHSFGISKGASFQTALWGAAGFVQKLLSLVETWWENGI